MIVGVDARGEKHFLAIEDGIRESTKLARSIVDLKARGMNAPELAIGDGMGFWAALEEAVFRNPSATLGCTKPAMCSMR